MSIKPWTPWSMMGLKGLTTATGISVDYLAYSAWMIVISLISMLLFLLCGKFIFRVDVSKMKNADFTKLGAKINYDKKQKFATLILAAIVVALYVPSVLPKDMWIYSVLNKLSAVGVIGAVTVVLCCVKMDGEPLMDFAKTAKEAIPWSMVVLLAAVGPLGSALMNSETGITRAVLGLMKPILPGKVR